jgi:hypothetical protein
MANGAYGKSIKKMVDGTGLAWTGALWKCVLVDATYTVDLVNHDFLDDITVGKRVATSAALTTLAVADDGIFNADPAVFTAVTGASAPYLVIYKDTAGADSVKELFLYFDTLSGLPVTPNGTNVTITWATDANKIFHI